MSFTLCTRTQDPYYTVFKIFMRWVPRWYLKLCGDRDIQRKRMKNFIFNFHIIRQLAHAQLLYIPSRTEIGPLSIEHPHSLPPPNDTPESDPEPARPKYPTLCPSERLPSPAAIQNNSRAPSLLLVSYHIHTYLPFHFTPPTCDSSSSIEKNRILLPPPPHLAHLASLIV